MNGFEDITELLLNANGDDDIVRHIAFSNNSHHRVRLMLQNY